MFLCPANLESMPLRGNFGSKYFDYVKLKVEGCDLGAECLPDDELQDKTINFVSLSAHPNLLGDN